MGADILIHRCTLRIARRGGWSWGADPRGLLKAAMQRLPELIAARLGELWPAHDGRQIAAPLRLGVSLRLDELLALTGDAAGDAHAPAMLAGSLAQRIDQMVQDFVLREAGAVAGDRPAIPSANELVAAELRASGADEALIATYEQADPAAMSVSGLARYWKKIHPAALG